MFIVALKQGISLYVTVAVAEVVKVGPKVDYLYTTVRVTVLSPASALFVTGMNSI